jgi:predicted DNA-binding protein (UPF0251 family)
MNNYLPTDSEPIYYVYKHTDPRTQELIYIGHGARGRAWTHGSKLTALRSQEHLAHLEDMVYSGYNPCDWVALIYKGLTKEAACKQEQEFIRSLKPRYNLPQGKQLLKLTPEQFELCKVMREEGLFYHDIAKEVGVSTMTIYRALNGQTKNIGDDYAA